MENLQKRNLNFVFMILRMIVKMYEKVILLFLLVIVILSTLDLLFLRNFIQIFYMYLNQKPILLVNLDFKSLGLLMLWKSFILITLFLLVASKFVIIIIILSIIIIILIVITCIVEIKLSFTYSDGFLQVLKEVCLEKKV